MINTLAKNGSCCPTPDTQVMKGTCNLQSSI